MNRKTLSVAAILGTGFAVSLAPIAQADNANPFASSDAAVTLVAEHHEEGEGSCGTKDGHHDDEHAEGSCGSKE
jgi:uncharacterized low-complexity protein